MRKPHIPLFPSTTVLRRNYFFFLNFFMQIYKNLAFLQNLCHILCLMYIGFQEKWTYTIEIFLFRCYFRNSTNVDRDSYSPIQPVLHVIHFATLRVPFVLIM